MKILIALLVMLLAGCAIHTYGKMTCDGKCDLVIEREVKELDPKPNVLPMKKD